MLQVYPQGFRYESEELPPYPLQGQVSQELNLMGCELSHASLNHLWLFPHITP